MPTFVPDAPAVPKPGFVPDPSTEPVAALVDPRMAPETMLAQKEAVAVRSAARRARDVFQRENAKDGVLLDVDAELPPTLRARVSFEGNIDKQVDLLSRREGILAARKSKDGSNVIVRVPDETGKPKDVLLHPLTATLSAGDVAGAAAPILKAGAVGGMALATGGMSLPATAGILAGTAAGTEAATTGASRVLAGQDIDPAELAARSGKEGAINAALPLAGAAASGVARGTRALLTRNPSELAQRVAGASQRTGVPVFPSQTADSRVLARGEEFAGLSSLKEQQQKALGAAFDREIGAPPTGVLSESDIAQKVQPIFAADAEAAERGARVAMTDAERAAQAELTRQLDSGLVPPIATNSAVGQRIRSKFDEFVQAAKAQADIDYPKFYAKAAEEGIELDKSPITALVAKIEREDPAGVAEFLAPSVKQVKTVERKLTKPLAEAEPTGMLSASGQPIMTPEVPAPPLTFDEAIRQRAIVRAKLDSPMDPMGDVVKSYYKQLEKAYTDSINEALSRGSDELRALYQTAAGGYKGAAEVLEKGVVQKLFREPGEAGRVTDENVVKQIFTGDGKLEALRDMKRILGADSPDYKLLLRQGVQNFIDDAAQKGTGGLIDVNDFLRRVNGLDKEMRAEIFGRIEPALKATADAMAIAQKGPGAVAKIPADELQDALAAAPRSVKSLIEQGVRRQKAYEAEYLSTLGAKLAGRDLGIKDLGNLDRFVTDFVPQASAADMRQILARIEASAPGSSNEVRQRVLANIRRDVAAPKELGKRTTSETFDLDPVKIKEITEGKDADKYRAILGDRGMQFLEDMATVAESNALRIERGAKEGVTPRIFGKEAISGAAGFMRNAISTGVDLATILPRAIVGNAERFGAVRDFLMTGKLPTLLPPKVSSVVRPAALAAPQLKDVEEATVGEKRKNRKYKIVEAK